MMLSGCWWHRSSISRSQSLMIQYKRMQIFNINQDYTLESFVIRKVRKRVNGAETLLVYTNILTYRMTYIKGTTGAIVLSSTTLVMHVAKTSGRRSGEDEVI